MEQTATQLEDELDVKEEFDENLEYAVGEAIETEGIRSEAGKKIYKDNIPDMEEYVRQKETELRKMREDEELTKARRLEQTAKESVEQLKKMCVDGEYDNHYTLFEKLQVALSTKINPKLEQRVTNSINNAVSVRSTKATMRKLQGAIKKYESLQQDSEDRVAYYERETEGVEDKIAEYKSKMVTYNNSTEDAEQKLKELQRDKLEALESGEAGTAQKVKDEIRLLKSDKTKFLSARQKYANMIITGSKKLGRKKFGFVGSSRTSEEYDYVLQELKNTHEDLRDMLQDYGKYGIPIAISDGRRAVAWAHDLNDKIADIDQRNAEYLSKVGPLRRDRYIGGSNLEEACRELGDEMSRTNNERYIQALNIGEKVLAEQMGA